MKTRSLPTAGLALLLAGCAQITAPNQDLMAPATSVELKATASNGLFSSIPGSITVAAVTMQRAAAAQPPPAFANTGNSGQTATFTFTPAPPGEFVNGDLLSVTWSAEAVPILGSHYTVTQTSSYAFHGRIGK